MIKIFQHSERGETHAAPHNAAAKHAKILSRAEQYYNANINWLMVEHERMVKMSNKHARDLKEKDVIFLNFDIH